MVLQLLTSTAYALIESSWMVSTVIVKYFLLSAVLIAFSRRKDYIEDFRSIIDEYSPGFVTSIVLIGFLALASGINVKPVSPIFSNLIAVIYFGYLFWEF